MDRADRGQGNAQRYINSFKWSATAETPQSCKAITKESFGCAPEIWQDNSVIEDDDAPLDAFDRELLAQANVQARFSTGDAAVPDLFYDESSVSASATPLSATKSPYFNPPQGHP
ncbi:hypothetical protein AAP_02480 [Ascosphaera apis ARSEF 7405]|uniref:Uncharacterized protein n=1 Tax=Ascosphaera apis ARSEF 7405 TaxID=392613 RepID=A0A167ZRS7_9EURO|nr:hypothetical protein AAP_02480 [Ascosphaera apis ARSEF 7405]